MGGYGMRVAVMLALLTVVASCGDNLEPSPLPLLLDHGGPHMSHPKLVPIFFADDAGADQMTRFSQWIVTSSWLEAVGAAYGVGSGSVLGVVHRPEGAPDAISDAEIVDLLYAGLADRTIPEPSDGLGDVLYMVHLPSHTVVTAGSAMSCVTFGAYHDSARRNGVELAYAVVPTCPPFVDDLVGTPNRELASSHELIEAATDPIPSNHPGFQLSDSPNPWLIFGDEVADLCFRSDGRQIWHEAGFVAQRSWSNAAAAAGEDPCVPGASSAPYFNVDVVTRTVLRIPSGGHQTIELRGWGTGLEVNASWSLSAMAVGFRPLGLTLGANRIGAGETTTLDVVVPVGTPTETSLRFYVDSGTDGDRQLPMFAIAGDPCSSFAGCEACTVQYGCGFCAATGRCEAQSGSASADSSCPGSLATWTGSCSGFCAQHSGSCVDCASQYGCGWCSSGTGQCLELGHDDDQPATGSCRNADWSVTPSYCPP